MTKSAIKGTTWYWREGRMKMMPIGSDLRGIRNRELCLPISQGTPIDLIREELENHQLDVHMKIINHGFSSYPAGTKILYAYCPIANNGSVPGYQENLNNLEQYILNNGGHIYSQKDEKDKKITSKIDLKSIFKLFGRG